LIVAEEVVKALVVQNAFPLEFTFYRRAVGTGCSVDKEVTVPDGVSSVATVGVTVTVKVTELLTATEADDALRANVAGIVATD